MNMMKLLRHTMLIIATFTVLSSCEYDFIVVDQPDPEVPVKFSEEVLPVFSTQNCIACHNTGGTSPDLTEGNAYNSIVPALINSETPELSDIYAVPSPSGNHPVKYSPTQAAIILSWIQQGAENN
jgi:mono/diheme cytochrome c family protein